MAITTVSVAGIESYQPAIDYRKSGRVGILSGRNFAWDAKGCYAAFASRLVAGTESIGESPDLAQQLDYQTQVHVAVDAQVWRFVPSSIGSPVGSWELLDTLVPNGSVPTLPQSQYTYLRWTSAYLGYSNYASHFDFGTYRVDLSVVTPTYTELTDVSVPGFPSNPMVAIGSSNGRMLYMTESTFYWSGPNDPEDLVPVLGGAGFKIIGESIGGIPFAMTPVSQGAIIWTTAGALAVEFIGGDFVFRFWEIATNLLPLSAFAITETPDNEFIILTRLGLFRVTGLAQPQPITPMFNEFLREYLRLRPLERGHIWYSITENRVYLAMREGSTTFSETACLDITLDKWGLFNENHMGFFDYGIERGQLAWANPQGIASFLLSPEDPRKGRENPQTPGDIRGLGSEVTIGWIRSENFVPVSDAVQELNEIRIWRENEIISDVTVFDEGYLSASSFDIVDEGLITDPITDEFDEGYVSDEPAAIDYGLIVITDAFDFPDPSGTGTTQNFEPILVRRSARSDLWVCGAPAYYHRLKFVADTPDRYFKINNLDLTYSYSGQIV